jgi:hypothetical protein
MIYTSSLTVEIWTNGGIDKLKAYIYQKHNFKLNHIENNRTEQTRLSPFGPNACMLLTGLYAP